jgi:hypothetical protein
VKVVELAASRAHPELRIHLVLSDEQIDPVQGGYDVTLRIASARLSVAHTHRVAIQPRRSRSTAQRTFKVKNTGSRASPVHDDDARCPRRSSRAVGQISAASSLAEALAALRSCTPYAASSPSLRWSNRLLADDKYARMETKTLLHRAHLPETVPEHGPQNRLMSGE